MDLENGKSEAQKSHLASNVVAMLISGISIGWLMGMSVSPTAQAFLSAVIALFVSIMGLIAGTKVLPDRINYLDSVNLLPVGVFMLFLAFGSGVGVYSRANMLLGQSPKELVATYTLDSTQQKEFLRELFFRHMNDTLIARVRIPFQYSASSPICMAVGTELRMGLKNLESSEAYKTMIENAPDSTLIRIRDEKCSEK